VGDHDIVSQEKDFHKDLSDGMQNIESRILAIGAHAGDIEVTCAAVLAKHSKRGDKVTLFHLTLGEGGNPKMSPQEYGEQKRSEALSAAKTIDADVLFGPYKDGELPNDEQVRCYVAEIIRRVKPTTIITHWRKSIHKDHSNAHGVVNDAVLLASLEGVVTESPRHRDIKGIYYTENWEDPEEFKPFIYVDVSAELMQWRECITQYQFIKGGISTFPYLEYYESLLRIRGAEMGVKHAEAFEVDPIERKRRLEFLS
jgi:LmbE family N-acetylglucosaminyl deacetylase